MVTLHLWFLPLPLQVTNSETSVVAGDEIVWVMIWVVMAPSSSGVGCEMMGWSMAALSVGVGMAMLEELNSRSPDTSAVVARDSVMT